MSNLVLKNIEKNFFRKKVLKNISYTFESGNVYGLIGPNGSGKTTIMKGIYKLVKFTKGEMLLDDKPIKIEDRNRISFMPTEDYFYTQWTVMETLGYYESNYKDFDKNKAIEILSKMQLPLDEKIKGFSTGMKMRLKVTLCLARESLVYMLDEPLNGIDVISKDLIRDVIVDKTGGESIIIISSHMLSDMEQILDSVLFIREGELALEGNLEDLRMEKGKSLEALYWEVYNERTN